MILFLDHKNYHELFLPPKLTCPEKDTNCEIILKTYQKFRKVQKFDLLGNLQNLKDVESLTIS